MTDEEKIDPILLGKTLERMKFIEEKVGQLTKDLNSLKSINEEIKSIKAETKPREDWFKHLESCPECYARAKGIVWGKEKLGDRLKSLEETSHKYEELKKELEEARRDAKAKKSGGLFEFRRREG